MSRRRVSAIYRAQEREDSVHVRLADEGMGWKGQQALGQGTRPGKVLFTDVAGPEGTELGKGMRIAGQDAEWTASIEQAPPRSR